MTSFAVDLELMTELVERMITCGQRLEQVQDDVDARVRRVHAVWRGAAAAKQAEAHQRWVTGAAQMREALGILRSIAATAGDNYSAAARANRQMWAQ